MTAQKQDKNSKKMKLDLNKFKKSPKPSAKDGAKKAPLTRSQKIFRGPLFWIIIAIFAVTIFGQITSAASRYTQVETSQVVDAISKAQVESAVIIDKSQKIKLILSPGNTIKGSSKVEASYVARQEPTLVDALTANPPTKGWNVDVPTQSFLTSLFFTFGPILIIGFLFFLMMSQAQGGNRVFSFGKSRAKLQNNEVPQNTFDDVAGADEAIAELEEIKDFLADPAKYAVLGAKIPKGVLLYGPPGTGKTLLARAVAGEAQVPFYSISGSDFVEMFVGVGAARVRDLFAQAKANAPAIVFVDEIDAVGRQRGAGMGGGHDEREQTLNQLLVEMDGFEANGQVILIAATNRPDVLDPALLRPGRFDRQIPVERPDLKGREDILAVHAKGKPLSKDVELVAYALPHTDPVHKITIMPRGRALGYTMVLPDDDKYSTTRNQLLDQLAYSLGGRAAEELIFHDPSTGASNDIEKATALARAMVTQYGMTEAIGAIKLGSDTSEPFMGRDFGHQRDYSENVAAIVDAEIRKLIENAHHEAYELLVENRTTLDAMVLALLEKETLNKDEIAKIFKKIKKRNNRPAWTGSAMRIPSQVPPVDVPARIESTPEEVKKRTTRPKKSDE